MDTISNIIYSQSFDLVTKRDLRCLVNAIMVSSCHYRSKTSFSMFLWTKSNEWLESGKSMSPPWADERQRFWGILDEWTEERTQSKEKTGDRNDLMSILSDARDPKTGDGLTEDEVRNEARSLLAAGWSFTLNHISQAWAKSDLIHRMRHDSQNPLNHHVPTLPPPRHLCSPDQRSPLHIHEHRTHPPGSPPNLLSLPPRLPRRSNASRTTTSGTILARNRSRRRHHSRRTHPSRFRSRSRPMGPPP